MDHIDHKMGPGYDNTPPKLIKEPSDEFTVPIASLINESIRLGHFPDGFKITELAPYSKVLTTYLKVITAPKAF